MAYQGQILGNQEAEHSITFLQTANETGGKLLEMKAVYPPHSTQPPTHYHPYQQEYFTVITGQLTVKMQGNIHQYSAGEQFQVPAGTVHSMWNAEQEPVTFLWKVIPALRTSAFMETVHALAQQNAAAHQKELNTWQKILVARYFSKEFRVPSPPYFLTWIMVKILYPFARRFEKLPGKMTV